jgi:nitrate reductase gamma subunit
MVPFHYGILFVLLGHLVAFLIPRSVLWWNAHPARLYVLEITALAAGVLTLVGFVSLILRRLGDSRLRRVTTVSDWVLYGMLVVQIYAGIHVAVFWGWGSSWFAASLSPYLWSLVRLSPDITYVTPLPLAFKVHLLGAFALIAYFPFTRLVHILVIPNMYLWRRPQVVRWYGVRRS